VFIVILTLFLPPSCATNCLCDGNNCAYSTSDYVFFVPYVIILGLAAIM
jgi:hypothetical protein